VTNILQIHFINKALPKPGSIKKPAVQNKKEQDDEAWLDDILG
jgi:hypothetical protein